MSENFLAISFDCSVSPGIDLSSSLTQENLFSSWGFAWYPTGENIASVFQGGRETPTDLITQTLSDWKRFQSTCFICNFSNFPENTDQKDIMPFTKNMAGKDWTWLSVGKIERTGRDGDSVFTDVLGQSGAEEGFCILLDYLNKYNCRSLSGINYKLLQEFFKTHKQFDECNLLLCDGKNLLAYRGAKSTQELYISRVTPPHDTIEIACGFMTVDLESSSAEHRTVTTISTTPLLISAGQRTIAQEGMVVVKRGSITWESNINSVANSRVNEEENTHEELPAPLVISQKNQKITTNIKSITETEKGVSLNYRSLKLYHKTTYRYSKVVRRSTHIFRLSPVEDEVQEIEESFVTFSVKNRPLFYEDAFGNRAIHLTIEEPYKEFTIISEAKIKIYALPPDNFESPLRKAEIPLLWMPWQRQMMLPYLLPPELPESQLSELSEYAMSFVERNDYQLLETLEDINRTIFSDYKYKSGSTVLSSTPFDIYVNREGVCQDFANLFICLTRILSIPSRYRMGYIFTGGNYENKIQSDASHAWVEVYLPYLGWRGFDPTNGCRIGQDHIRVACGRNYIDATPTSGTIFKGGGKESLSIEVKIEE